MGFPRVSVGCEYEVKGCYGFGEEHKRHAEMYDSKVTATPAPIPAGATEEDMKDFEDFERFFSHKKKPPARNYAKDRSKSGKKRRKQ